MRFASAYGFVSQSYLIQQFFGFVRAFGDRPAEQAGEQRDVLLDGPVRKKAELLDDIADAAAQLNRIDGANVLAVDEDGSGGWLEQAVDEAQGGGFAGTAST